MSPKLVLITPIARYRNRPKLWYFSSENIVLGQVLELSIRSRKVTSVVTEIRTTSTNKEVLKKLPYKIKKLRAKLTNYKVDNQFLEIVARLTNLLMADMGHILNLALPRFIILNKIGDVITSINKGNHKSIHLICAPNSYMAERLYNSLEQVDKEVTFTMHYGHKAEEIVNRLNLLKTNKYSKVIITSKFLEIMGKYSNRITIDTYMDNYYTNTRPSLDVRKYIELYASKTNIPLDYTGVLPQINKSNSTSGASTSSIVSKSDPEIIIPELKSELHSDLSLNLLCHETIQMIDMGIRKHNSILIVCTRKGLAPISICNDCKTIVSCKHCNNPLTLRKAEDRNYYFCYRCNIISNSKILCLNCGSWNIRLLGIGIERIKQYVENKWPMAKCKLMSRDTESNIIAGVKKLESMEERGNIIICVSAIVPYLISKYKYSVILDIDTLLSIPEYTAKERLYRGLKILRNITTHKLIIQTYQSEIDILKYFKSKDDVKFVTEELADRRRFGYPPFMVIIKISIESPMVKHKELLSSARTALTPFKVFEIGTSKINSKTMRTVFILKVNPDDWPNVSLNATLEKISNAWTYVEIDPRSLS